MHTRLLPRNRVSTLKIQGRVANMNRIAVQFARLRALAIALNLTGLLASCGGASTGTVADSGPEKTTLSVSAVDPDGDALTYEWRVTAGSVDNRNAATTTWTLPTTPGLHFAYVLISDGRGGYVQHQYAVGSDRTATALSAPAQSMHTPAAPDAASLGVYRVRIKASGTLDFKPESGGAAVDRDVYMAGQRVRLVDASGSVISTGTTDRNGEWVVSSVANDTGAYRPLPSGQLLRLECAASAEAAYQPCSAGTALFTQTSGQTYLAELTVDATPGANLRVYGHVDLADGVVCGVDDDFFRVQRGATVQLLGSDGAALSQPVQTNRFGDYALSAAVAPATALQLKVTCGSETRQLPITAAEAPTGADLKDLEKSVRLSNRRPVVQRMVANGPDGNVRGKEIVPLTGAASNELKGAAQFLAYKGLDTRRSACNYYKALGMVKDCTSQGDMVQPATMEEWKRAFALPPYSATGVQQASADYINKMDLNLVRRMTAAKTADDRIAFLVCNHPGPDGQTQAEINEVVSGALTGERLIACVGMTWSTLPGVNGGKPFTQFVTFGPDGSLLPSVNLDGRGEKFLPGACIACHGGSRVNGRFPETGRPSPDLGSGFLPFDTGNYFLSTAAGLTEAAQGDSFFKLNQLVRDTERLDKLTGQVTSATAVTRLIDGWYRNGRTLDKEYVPNAWVQAQSGTDGQGQAVADAAALYREVVGPSCRTCHVSMGPSFDWDSLPRRLTGATDFVKWHVCGGGPSLAINASMPNALVSVDRVQESAKARALKKQFFGCESSLPDPAYGRR